MWAINMAAAAPEAQYRKIAVKGLINFLARVHKQRRSFLILQVAAAVRVGGIHLEVAQ